MSDFVRIPEDCTCGWEHEPNGKPIPTNDSPEELAAVELQWRVLVREVQRKCTVADVCMAGCDPDEDGPYDVTIPIRDGRTVSLAGMLGVPNCDDDLPGDEEFRASLTEDERERLDEAAAKVMDYLKPENHIDWFTAVAFEDAAIQAAAEAIQDELDGSTTTDGKVGFPEYFGERAARAAIQAARPIIVQEERRASLRRRVLEYDTNRSAGSLQPMPDPYRKQE